MNIEVLDGGSTGTNATTVSTSVMVGVPLCPDLLRLQPDRSGRHAARAGRPVLFPSHATLAPAKEEGGV